MSFHRKVKIVATLGPASGDAETLAALIDAGANVFRINMSHNDPESLAQIHAVVRAAEKEGGHPIAILADLQGPKLRLGTFADGEVMLVEGQTFRLDLDDTPGDDMRAQLPHPEIFKVVKDGAILLLNDGKVRLKVIDHGEDFANMVVEIGGEISDRKGVNVPDVVVPLSALTEKDRRDLDAALALGVDWIGLSFVQRPEDVQEARKIVAGRAGVMVKVEKPAAVDCFDEIIDIADGVMVARGDLGVEMPLEAVPGIQKTLVCMARRAGKPVVVATQMLESMIESPTPTRAEISDVAGAIYEGADAVMLSAESAVGAYPIEAVATMARVAKKVEGADHHVRLLQSLQTPPEATGADAITAAAEQVANTIGASAIICYTTSGSTALRAARDRPAVPVLVLTPSMFTARRMTLVWGVTCVLTEDAKNFRDMVMRASNIAEQEGLAARGDRIVITAGVPFGTPGSTNILRIAYVGTHRGVEPSP